MLSSHLYQWGSSTPSVAQTDGVKDKPKPALTKPVAKVETVESIEAEVDAIEEPKKTPPKKASVANEPSLDSLVSEWDDA